MAVTLDTRADFTLDAARQVGFADQPVALSAAAFARVANARRAFERYVAARPDAFIYGTTSSAGAFAHVRPEANENAEATRFIGSYCPQVACDTDIELPARTVRLVLLVRLASLIEGHGMLRPATLERVCDVLNAPPPTVPLSGVGGPGEVIAMAYLLAPMADVPLEPGELMGLLNGSAFAGGMVTEAALHARGWQTLAEALLALSVQAFNAPLEAYDPALHDITADADLRAVLHRLQHWLADVDPHGRRRYQAPVSFRILPHSLAVLESAITQAEWRAEEALHSVAGNPVFMPPAGPDQPGRVLSTGGFHNAQAARALDVLNLALADLITLLERQGNRLMSASAEDLPPLLVDRPMPPVSFLLWMQTGHAERARHAAQPALLPLGPEDPGSGQSNVFSPGFLAYERHLALRGMLASSLAVFAMITLEAMRRSGRPVPAALQSMVDTLTPLAGPFDTGATPSMAERLIGLKACLRDDAARLAAEGLGDRASWMD